MNRNQTLAALTRRLFAAISIVFATGAVAVDLADTPLFLTVDVPPNLLVTIDDSGSMSRAFTPDLCGNPNDVCDSGSYGNLRPRYVKSAYFNPIYYSPNIRYDPPKNAAGNALPTSFTAAYINGFDTPYGTVNLSTNYRPSAGLHIDSATSKLHRLMDHSDEDLNCPTTGVSKDICQYRNASGTWTNMNGNPSCSSPNVTNCRNDGMPAYYYVFNFANPGCTNVVANQRTDVDCYTQVLVGSAADTANFDFSTIPNGVDAEDKKQNFANWYSFYRTRNLATISGAARAFYDVNPTTRVGWQALNSCRGSSSSFVTNDCDGWQNFSGITNAVRPFTGTHKENFYKWLFRLPMNPTTPLREAMQRAGNYLTNSGATVAALTNTPYDHFTEVYAPEYLPISCRKNFHIMMTDGVWNDGLTTSNADDTNTAVPDPAGCNYRLSALCPPDTSNTATRAAPYRASEANSLADIAFSFWISDLASNLTNSILPNLTDSSGTFAERYWNPVNDLANWQHMVNFTVGLGLTPFLSDVGLVYGDEGYGGSFADLKSGAKAWPLLFSGTPAQQDGARVADLWHAAINSRGKFFSADSPGDLADAFDRVIKAVSDASPSAASLAANSTQLQNLPQSVVYQAKFNSRDWSGNFLALPVGSDGLVGSAYWDAANKLPAYDARSIFTIEGGTGQIASCTGALNLALKGTDDRCLDRLEWLKGNDYYEVRYAPASVSPLRSARPLATFRNRLTKAIDPTNPTALNPPNNKLGDIINSDPMYVDTKADYGYATAAFTEAASYASFIGSSPVSTRPPVIYVGANDGMLHAFQADFNQTNSGRELFAFIPGGVYSNLRSLTEPSYSHRYLVDGSSMASDAYWGTSWKTVLVGGLNSGGKSIYALDVTNPAAFTSSSVLWEYSDTTTTIGGFDLGLTYSQPQIGRLKNGDWVAIFGNGYNSNSGKAGLYVVKLSDGSLLAKIPAGTETGNGLSTPVLTQDSGKYTDYVYAGDLKGNLWKFDLTSAIPDSWGVGNGGNPIFVAERGVERQPITAQPKVSAHPEGGVLVLVGTGKYLGDSDLDDTSVQSFYGIWDKEADTVTVARSDLQVQTIDQQVTVGTVRARVTSQNSVDYLGSPGKRGWYLDLLAPSSTTGGERVVATSSFLEDRVIFTTVTPSRDPCAPGGDSFLMELLTLTGQRPEESVFDINGDGSFTSADNVGGFAASGFGSTVGIIKVPVILKKPDAGKAFKILTGTSGGFQSIANKIPQTVPGLFRIYWKQIQ